MSDNGSTSPVRREGGATAGAAGGGTLQSGLVQQEGVLRPESDNLHAQGGAGLMPFFAAGMVINIVMLAAFFVWAFRQWKKK